MKNLLLLVSLAAVSLSFSSCCSMFGTHGQTAGYRTETRQVKTCGYDVVTEEVYIKGDSKSGKGGMVKTIEKKVPHYKTVTKKVRIKCGQCARFYCPKKDCCGSTSDSTLSMTTVQGSSGSPNVGLVPSMRKLAP